jgi:hypothetical protein
MKLCGWCQGLLCPWITISALLVTLCPGLVDEAPFHAVLFFNVDLSRLAAGSSVSF